jgi:hypothetical protein
VCNIPLLFNTITVHLQIHIINAPAYKVLLGRPFDMLTQSQVKNVRDGGQTITITDPNTGQSCTIPTHVKDAMPKIQLR